MIFISGFSFFQDRKREKFTKINNQFLSIKTESFIPMGLKFQLSKEEGKGCGMVFAGWFNEREGTTSPHGRLHEIQEMSKTVLFYNSRADLGIRRSSCCRHIGVGSKHRRG
jgi:hypothetical protein